MGLLNKNRSWRKMIAPYESPSVQRSVWQIFSTFALFFLCWLAAYWSLSITYWLTLVLTVITGGLLVRIFIIFHDCCHGSLFANRTANEVIGTISGILTCCPYYQWRYSHSVHHATNGNLDRRGTGDIWTLTVQEYLALSPMKRLGYRLYRNPLILFGLGPIYVFLFEYRFNRKEAKFKERLNTYVINLGIASLVGLLCWTFGWKAFLLIQGPTFLISGIAGFWLFYVQHQFEHTYFEKDEEWDHVHAALHGSSFYKLPKVLHWFTGNIGYHHIHHLSPRVPNYLLERAHKENTMFQSAFAITLWSSLRSFNFRIWDENRKQMRGFSYIKRFIADSSSKDLK